MDAKFFSSISRKQKIVLRHEKFERKEDAGGKWDLKKFEKEREREMGGSWDLEKLKIYRSS